MVATTRIVMPKTQVQLSAGGTNMSREGQVMCFFAGDKLLTVPNQDVNEHMEMFKILGLHPQKTFDKKEQPVSVDEKNT